MAPTLSLYILMTYLTLHGLAPETVESSKISILSKHNPTLWKRTKCGFNGTDIPTKWGRQIDPSNASTLLPEYPRPQFKRDTNNSWVNLNGLWEFEPALNNNSILNPPFNQTLNNTILVPFPVESCLSGIGQTYQYLWYRFVFSLNESWFNITENKHILLLNFGAIDWLTNVLINGVNIAQHIGGYDSFTVDLTPHLTQTWNEILLFVFDPSNIGAQPNGKQNIARITQPKGDQFSPSSGIWQTVWIERVPQMHINSLKIATDLNYINITVFSHTNNVCNITIFDPKNNSMIITQKMNQKINESINISIANAQLWSPKTPNLYGIKVEMYGNDTIESYAGMRTISVKPTLQRPFISDTGIEQSIGRMHGGGDIIKGYPIDINTTNECWAKCNKTNTCLSWNYECKTGNINPSAKCYLYSNNIPSSNLTFNHCMSSGEKNVSAQYVSVPHLNDKPVYFAGWLDQSYYSDGLYAPPSNDILYFDVSAVIEFGFNTARVHEKVQPELYYYFADLLGVLLWQDMPQKYGNANDETIPYFVNDLTAMIRTKFNHPCIVQWQIFNENDCVGVFEPYKTNKYNTSVTDMYNLVRSLDETRLINIDSGGMATSSHIGDVFDVHDYPGFVNVESSQTQYGAQGEGGSCAVGGYVNHEWKIDGCETFYNCGGEINNPKVSPQVVVDFYRKQVEYLLSDPVQYNVHATIYVEIADIETECHGFHTYDRINKYNMTQVSILKELNQKLINSRNDMRV